MNKTLKKTALGYFVFISGFFITFIASGLVVTILNAGEMLFNIVTENDELLTSEDMKKSFKERTVLVLAFLIPSVTSMALGLRITPILHHKRLILIATILYSIIALFFFYKEGFHAFIVFGVIIWLNRYTHKRLLTKA